MSPAEEQTGFEKHFEVFANCEFYPVADQLCGLLAIVRPTGNLQNCTNNLQTPVIELCIVHQLQCSLQYENVHCVQYVLYCTVVIELCYIQCTSCSAHYSTRMFTVCSMYCTVLQSQSCAIYSAPVAVLTTVREVHCVQYILYCTVLYCSKKCSYLNYNTYATYKKSARKQFFKKPYLDPTLF